MATSAATHLADVDAAITATLAGQVASYSISARSLQRFSITELFAIRDKLSSEVNHASGSSIRLAKFGKANP